MKRVLEFQTNFNSSTKMEKIREIASLHLN